VCAQQQLDLVWDAPGSCPQAGAVREKIRALSGDAPKTAGGLRAEGTIVRVDGRFRLTLVVRDGSVARKRTIESEACADLAGAAAVTLGLLLQKEPAARREALEAQAGETRDRDEDTRETDGETARSSDGRRDTRDAEGSRDAKPPAATPAKTPRDAARPPDAAKPNEDEEKPSDEDETPGDGVASERRWRMVLVAPLGTLDLGSLPKPVGGIGAGLGVRYDAWRVAAAVRTLASQTLRADALTGFSARAEVVSAELAACRGFRASRVELAPCAVVTLDWITARGLGPGVSSRAGRSKGLVLGAGAAGHLHLFDWLALVATASVGIQTSRARLVIDGLGEVGRIGPARLSLGVGAEWIF
jgi:hypothetical protein